MKFLEEILFVCQSYEVGMCTQVWLVLDLTLHMWVQICERDFTERRLDCYESQWVECTLIFV